MISNVIAEATRVIGSTIATFENLKDSAGRDRTVKVLNFRETYSETISGDGNIIGAGAKCLISGEIAQGEAIKVKGFAYKIIRSNKTIGKIYSVKLKKDKKI